MRTSGFHKIGFKESTLVKLELYEKYLTEWLPTFAAQVNPKSWSGIRIFDFFCGPGRDENNVEGSPLIAIKVALSFSDILQKNGHKIHFFFSDKSKENVEKLKKELEKLNLPSNFHHTVDQAPFKHALLRQISNFYKSANLIFADQFGIKHFDQRTFETIKDFRGTDVLFFISSSYARRFFRTPEIGKYFSDKNIFSESSHADSHRAICDYYRSMIPAGRQYYVAPFSLKRGSNIHGLIFGSSHYKGLLKFLQVCWKIDPERGEANFDIDMDQLPQQGQTLDFFKTQSSKLETFQSELETRILQGTLTSDAEIFMFSLEAGFVPALHAKPVIKRLLASGIIEQHDQVRLSDTCLKEPRALRLSQQPV